MLKKSFLNFNLALKISKECVLHTWFIDHLHHGSIKSKQFKKREKNVSGKIKLSISKMYS